MNDYFEMLRQRNEMLAKIREDQAEHEANQRAIQAVTETICTITRYNTMAMCYLALNPNISKEERR